MKTNSQQSFLFRFKIQFKTVSTTYIVQVVSNDLQQYMLNSNTSTTAVQNNILGYLMHLRNQINVPKQVNKVHSGHSYSPPVVNQQSQHQVPLCLQCHDGSYFSLSQHSSNLYCQANNNASGFNLKVTSQCKHPSSSTAPAHY